MQDSGVYALMERLQKKTGIKVTPHMLRHYFCKCSPEGWMEAGTYQSSAWASKYRNNDEIFKYIGSGVDGCQ